MVSTSVTAATTTTATTAPAVVDVVGQGGRGDGSRFVSAQSSIVDSRATSPTATDTITVKTEPPPRYQMCRAVKMVEALWSEWTVGLRGGPAIADLDGRWEAGGAPGDKMNCSGIRYGSRL
ncbi:transcriptional activator of glycolytic enzymes domain-containing protein [Hirsutella rhossiliensis]